MFTIEHGLLGKTWMSAADIERYLVGTPMVGLGQVAKETEVRLGIRADYIIGHAIHESDFGRSRIVTDKKNLFGWGAADTDPYAGAYTYTSFADCINQVMDKIKASYLTVGGTYFNGSTLTGMNVRYATDKLWAVKISTHINNMHSKISFTELYDRVYKASGTINVLPNILLSAVDDTRGYLGDYVKAYQVMEVSDQATIKALQSKITAAKAALE